MQVGQATVNDDCFAALLAPAAPTSPREKKLRGVRKQTSAVRCQNLDRSPMFWLWLKLLQLLSWHAYRQPWNTNPKIIIAGGGSIYLEKGISFWEEKKLSCGCPLQEVFCGFIKCAFIKVGSRET